MILRAPTLADVYEVQRWRMTDDVRLGLRTGRILTEGEQEGFYANVISSRCSPHRYWSVYEDAVGGDEEAMVAFTGLTDIDWEAGHGEISLIVRPDTDGVGGLVVEMVLREAFERMRLLHVFGECYNHNPAIDFWERMISKHHGGSTRIPGRKWWSGELHDAMLFWFTP